MPRLQSEARRNALLSAATRVIAAQGLGAATATTAREAAVSIGSLFLYFGTKATLVNELHVGLKTDRLDALAERIRASGGRAEVLATDVTQLADLEQLVTTAVERFDRLDVLVRNAGIARTGLMAALRI